MSVNSRGNRSTAFGLEVVTPETTVTTTPTWSYGGEEVHLPTVLSTRSRH